MFKCDICEKGITIGKDGTYRHGGGWARRAPKVKKIWKPNLRSVKLSAGGRTRRVRLCAKCLKKINSIKKEAVKKTTPVTQSTAQVAA